MKPNPRDNSRSEENITLKKPGSRCFQKKKTLREDKLIVRNIQKNCRVEQVRVK